MLGLPGIEAAKASNLQYMWDNAKAFIPRLESRNVLIACVLSLSLSLLMEG